MFTWGEGEDGQLGQGSNDECTVPTAVAFPDSSVITSVASGAEHTMAVSHPAMKVFSWGECVPVKTSWQDMASGASLGVESRVCGGGGGRVNLEP